MEMSCACFAYRLAFSASSFGRLSAASLAALAAASPLLDASIASLQSLKASSLINSALDKIFWPSSSAAWRTLFTASSARCLAASSAASLTSSSAWRCFSADCSRNFSASSFACDRRSPNFLFCFAKASPVSASTAAWASALVLAATPSNLSSCCSVPLSAAAPILLISFADSLSANSSIVASEAAGAATAGGAIVGGGCTGCAGGCAGAGGAGATGCAGAGGGGE